MKSIFLKNLFNPKVHLPFLFILIILISAPTFRWTFRGDEYPLIRRVDEAIDRSGIFSLVTSTQRGYLEGEYNWSKYASNTDLYRPVLEIILSLERSLYGFWYPGYRFTNILIIGLSSIAVYFLSLELLSSMVGAFIASVMFTLSFTHTHPFVGMISNRTDSLVGTLIILSVLLFVIFRRNYSGKLFLLVIVCVGLALFSKETAIGLPFILVTYDILFTKPLNLRKIIIHFCTITILLFYMFIRYQLFEGVGDAPLPYLSDPIEIVKNLVIVWHDGIFPFELALAVKLFIIMLLMLSFILIWPLIPDKKYRLRIWLFCIIAYYLSSSPVLILGVSERFLYASTAFLWILLADVLLILFKLVNEDIPVLKRLTSVFLFVLILLSFTIINLRELAKGIDDGNRASQIAKHLKDGMENLFSSIEPGDKVFFITVPAGCGEGGIFYNGLNDAIFLNYGDEVRSYILTQFHLKDCEYSAAVKITQFSQNKFAVEIEDGPLSELILSQTEVTKLTEGESITNRYSQVTLGSYKKIPTYNRFGNQWDRDAARLLQVEIDPNIITSSGENHFVYHDGNHFWFLNKDKWESINSE